jgi:hypothetical protein
MSIHREHGEPLMMRIRLLLSVSILSMVAVSLCRAVVTRPSKLGSEPFVESTSTQDKPCFLTLSSALTFTKEGEPIGFHTYSVSDGTKVQASYFYYRSSKKANREMTRKRHLQ